MASARLSWGIDDPAACLAVRGLLDLASCRLGPSGQIRGGVAVPVHDQPTDTAMKGPRPQRHLLCGPTASRADLGGGVPAIADHDLAPSQAVLYPSWRENSVQAASVMARARRWLRSRLATGRSSMASPLWVLASWLETSWRKLRRMSAMRWCSRASRRAAFTQLPEPRWARESARERCRSRPSRRTSGLSAVKRQISTPSAPATTAKAARPRSIPTNLRPPLCDRC